MFRIPENWESKYRFVTLAALRAEQLQCGSRARLESAHTKPTVIAQQEVSAGLVEPWDPAEADRAVAEESEE